MSGTICYLCLGSLTLKPQQFARSVRPTAAARPANSSCSPSCSRRRFLLQTSAERRIGRSHSEETGTFSVSNPCSVLSAPEVVFSPLDDELLQSLKSQLHLRNTAAPDCPLVFFRIIMTKENPVSSWVPIGDFRRVRDTACAKCGLAGRIFHDLRRSAVRNLIRAGVQERVAM